MPTRFDVVFVTVACIRDAAIDSRLDRIEDFRVICNAEYAAVWKVDVGDFEENKRISFAFLNRLDILTRPTRDGRRRLR